MADTIKLRKNGPLILSEPIRILDEETGKEVAVAAPNVALCRCGGSKNKPFCDGTHKQIGFLGTVEPKNLK